VIILITQGGLMGKKVFIIMAVLALGFLTIGCSAQSSKIAMQIGPAELTEQESQIVKLIQDKNNAIFDYTINSNIKSVTVVCYKLDENGKWVANVGPSSIPVKESTGRMALSFENLADGYRVAIQESDNMSANKIETAEKIDTKGKSSATSYASSESIECEKEIPLAIQVFTSKNGISSHGVEYFNNPEEYQKREYDDVYVIAIKFSKSELE
jgi:methionine synthase I (cobalamin-dependent)